MHRSPRRRISRSTPSTDHTPPSSTLDRLLYSSRGALHVVAIARQTPTGAAGTVWIGGASGYGVACPMAMATEIHGCLADVLGAIAGDRGETTG